MVPVVLLLATSGLATSGLATSGLATSGLATSGLATSGLATSGLATSGLATSDPIFAQNRTPPSRSSATVALVIETDRGNIGVELDSARAPVTVANFLRYVDGRFYDGGRFHRTVTSSNQPNDSVRIAVIQAGADTSRHDGFSPIVLERTSVTGISHKNGTLSMARAGPNTATSDFFICIGDQPSLDFGGHRNRDGQGFAAFGRVTSGMDVVRAIQASPSQGQRLIPLVQIRRIKRR